MELEKQRKLIKINENIPNNNNNNLTNRNLKVNDNLKTPQRKHALNENNDKERSAK